MRILLLLTTLLILAGCASKLVTSREDGTRIPGIPVGTPKLVKLTSVTSFKPVKEGQFEEYCNTPEVNSTIQFLPLGEVTYLNMDPAAIAKGEFSLEFSDSGNIKKVSLNSDASSGVDSVNTLASTLLPFIATPKPTGTSVAAAPNSVTASSAAASSTAKELKQKHCLSKGTEVSSIESIDVN